MYSRRTLLATVGTGILAGSFDVSAQQSARKTPRLGILLFNTPQIEPIGPLQEGLKAYGYEDGKTITIDYRFAEGKFERLPDLAADLVRLEVRYGSWNEPAHAGERCAQDGDCGERRR